METIKASRLTRPTQDEILYCIKIKYWLISPSPSSAAQFTSYFPGKLSEPDTSLWSIWQQRNKENQEKKPVYLVNIRNPVYLCYFISELIERYSSEREGEPCRRKMMMIQDTPNKCTERYFPHPFFSYSTLWPAHSFSCTFIVLLLFSLTLNRFLPSGFFDSPFLLYLTQCVFFALGFFPAFIFVNSHKNSRSGVKGQFYFVFCVSTIDLWTGEICGDREKEKKEMIWDLSTTFTTARYGRFCPH